MDCEYKIDITDNKDNYLVAITGIFERPAEVFFLRLKLNHLGRTILVHSVNKLNKDTVSYGMVRDRQSRGVGRRFGVSEEATLRRA